MKKTVIISVVLVCAIFALSKGYQSGKRELSRLNPDYYTIEYNPAVFHNADSLHYYMERAFLYDDADALGITGTAAFLFYTDTAAWDSLPIVSISEGTFMLLRASDLGSEDAQYVIECLQYHGLWPREEESREVRGGCRKDATKVHDAKGERI